MFDTSRRMTVLEIENGKVVGRREEPLDEDPVRKVEQIVGAAIGFLVCGAISEPFAEMLSTRGVRLAPFVAGDVDEVIRAFLAGSLRSPRFAMPGCCGRRLGFGGGGRGRRRRCGGGGPGRGWKGG